MYYLHSQKGQPHHSLPHSHHSLPLIEVGLNTSSLLQYPHITPKGAHTLHTQAMCVRECVCDLIALGQCEDLRDSEAMVLVTNWKSEDNSVQTNRLCS